MKYFSRIHMSNNEILVQKIVKKRRVLVAKSYTRDTKPWTKICTRLQVTIHMAIGANI